MSHQITWIFLTLTTLHVSEWHLSGLTTSGSRQDGRTPEHSKNWTEVHEQVHIFVNRTRTSSQFSQVLCYNYSRFFLQNGPYNCELCGESFSRKCTLKKSRYSWNGLFNCKLLAKAFPENALCKSTYWLIFLNCNCKLCGKSFYRKYTLNSMCTWSCYLRCCRLDIILLVSMVLYHFGRIYFNHRIGSMQYSWTTWWNI